MATGQLSVCMPDHFLSYLYCLNTDFKGRAYPPAGDYMIEAVRINLNDEKDAEFIIGKIIAQINRDKKTKNIEILEEFFKYSARAPVIRIFMD